MIKNSISVLIIILFSTACIRNAGTPWRRTAGKHHDGYGPEKDDFEQLKDAKFNITGPMKWNDSTDTEDEDTTDTTADSSLASRPGSLSRKPSSGKDSPGLKTRKKTRTPTTGTTRAKSRGSSKKTSRRNTQPLHGVGAGPDSGTKKLSSKRPGSAGHSKLKTKANPDLIALAAKGKLDRNLDTLLDKDDWYYEVSQQLFSNLITSLNTAYEENDWKKRPNSEAQKNIVFLAAYEAIVIRLAQIRNQLAYSYCPSERHADLALQLEQSNFLEVKKLFPQIEKYFSGKEEVRHLNRHHYYRRSHSHDGISLFNQIRTQRYDLSTFELYSPHVPVKYMRLITLITLINWSKTPKLVNQFKNILKKYESFSREVDLKPIVNEFCNDDISHIDDIDLCTHFLTPLLK